MSERFAERLRAQRDKINDLSKNLDFALDTLEELHREVSEKNLTITQLRLRVAKLEHERDTHV